VGHGNGIIDPGSTLICAGAYDPSGSKVTLNLPSKQVLNIIIMGTRLYGATTLAQPILERTFLARISQK